MSFDKAKVTHAAEKYLAQGKIPAAIEEYRRIVEHDAKDFATLNTLGDLYVRVNKKQEAITCFSKIAEHYREQGFAPKAIAMYKKIDRLNPGAPETANKLALLFETQGLLVDARAQYLIVAEAYSRAGQTQQALEVLRRVADLDPQNVEIRFRLAEGYLREGLQSEAANAFAEAGTQLLARGAFEPALEAYGRTLDIHPHDHSALSGLVDAHVARGTGDEAAEILERVVSERPDDVDLLGLLTRAYLEAEDAPSAERATAALVALEPANLSRFVDVARLYLKGGDTESAVRVLTGIVEQMLSGRKEDDLLELIHEVLARDPEQVEALRILVRVHWWQRDSEKLLSSLERLAEAAEAAHLVDEERSALSQLARLAPDQSRYLERLRALGGTTDETVESPYGFEPAGEEVPRFQSFMTTNVDAGPSVVEPLPAAEVAEFEWNSVAPPPEPAVTFADPAASFADLNGDLMDATPAPAFSNHSVAEQQPATIDFRDFDAGGVLDEGLLSGASASPGRSSPALDARHEAMLRQELDSVDFYIAQGYTDIASDTLEMLQRQFGAHAEINVRRERLKGAAPSSANAVASPGSVEEVIEFTDFNGFGLAEELTATAQTKVPAHQGGAKGDGAGIDPGLAAIFDEFRTAVEEEEPSTNGDYETHYNLGLAYKEMDLLDEAVEEFQNAAGLVTSQDGTARYLQCCNLLGHCFMQKRMPQLAAMWFKKGLDSPGHTEDEYQALRYELGTAYEQMGDLDRAIAVFTEVYGVNISYRGVSNKLRELQKSRG